MKLVRYGAPGVERLGLLDASGKLRDLSGEMDDIAGAALSDEGLERLRGLDPGRLPVVAGRLRLGPCVGAVGKFICVGLNDADHAAETGKAPPAGSILSMKATSAVCGPDNAVEMPRGSLKTDWEVELGVGIAGLGAQRQFVVRGE